MSRQTNILEYLENIVNIYPDKVCYANESEGFISNKCITVQGQ